ncbi:tetratricopeptide repeat protein [Cyanobacterium sp. Dongsha4]|uniref:tetratricopeptide repeat protein n=1 Tax=Cyanobacterium sp. DS4 TaxID=2878255 RepID=UPI002E8060BF|nr:tetratricopeptide repeat protein [Cyanobacterium sp. Dongsha4]WVL02234.1 tetratricopeptide repeat protein [Cyanobacterium sp. Dongsha4]
MEKLAIALIKSQLHHKCLIETQEAIHYTLQDMGFDSILTDDLGRCDRQYIILGVNNLLYPNQVELPPNSIIYNLEQIYPESPWIQSGYLDYLYQYPIWDYSLSNIAQLQKWGINNIQHLPIGYHPCLTCIPNNENQDIDVLFYGSINEHRQEIIDSLKEEGIKVEALFGVYGEERNRYIARSKIVLNMHFYEAQVFEIVRVSHLLANRVFVISEKGNNFQEESYFQEGLVFCNYEDLVSTCIEYLKRERDRKIIAERGYNLFTSLPLQEYLKPLINSLSQNIYNCHKFIKDFYRKNQAKTAFNQGHYQDAIALYEQSLQVDRDCLESHVYLALAFLYDNNDLASELTLYSFISEGEEKGEDVILLTENVCKLLSKELEQQLLLNNLELASKIKVYIESLSQ